MRKGGHETEDQGRGECRTADAPDGEASIDEINVYGSGGRSTRALRVFRQLFDVPVAFYILNTICKM